MAAIGPSGWEKAAWFADGVSTIWGEKINELRHQYLDREFASGGCAGPFLYD